jgi:hypothetical protein
MTSESKAIHSPQIYIVLMVELSIKEHHGEFKKPEQWYTCHHQTSSEREILSGE